MQKKAELQEEKVRLLVSIARIAEPDLISDVQKRSLEDELRSQDTGPMRGAVCGNPEGQGRESRLVQN